MAPRRGAASDAVAEETVAGLSGLSFNEPLSWRAGKPIATGELLRRLENLSKELRDMDQEETDKDSLAKVAKDLAGANLLSHKDRGVRAYTACCAVDILKLCAPDAPFTATQLKDIFTLFVVSILPALSDPSNAYNTQHMYVLNSLSEVKSIVLLIDVPNSEALILQLFTSFFDIISGSTKTSTGEQLSKHVEYNMNNVLVTLIDEAASLPSQVIDIIIAQFLRAATPGGLRNRGEVDGKQSTLLLKELPTAYKMAETLCNSCPEKMARYISQYFNDVIMDASAANNSASKSNGQRRVSDGGESEEEDSAAPDLKELEKAHNLLRELWRASPAVLQNVLPQVEAELSAENVQLRLLSTETLGDMISGIGSAGPPPPPAMDSATYPPVSLADIPEKPTYQSILVTPLSPLSFAQGYPSVYNSFISRKNDKSPVIRSGWTTAVGRILTTSAGGVGLNREDESMLVKGLAEKLNDSDERVRISAVKAVGTFNFRDIMTKLAVSGDISKPGSVMASLADRARDKKHAVRVEAMTILSRVWGVATGEIAAGNDSVVSMLGAIPSKIFDAYYTNDVDVNVLLDHVMFEHLVPLNYPPTKAKGSKQTNGSQANGDSSSTFDPDKARTERILLLLKSLDSKAKKAFFALQARQPTYSSVLGSLVKRSEEYNGGVTDGDQKGIKQKLDEIIAWLSGLLPDRQRVTGELWKYVKMHDRRTYQLLKFAMAPESDFKTVHNAIKEFSKRVQAAPSAPAGILESFVPLLYRSSVLIYNRSQLPAILQYSRSDENGLSETAHEMLQQISERNPEIFKTHVKELCKLLEEQAPSKTRGNDPSTVQTLKVCAGYALKFPNEIPQDRKFVQALLNFAQFASPPKAAKYAVTILMIATNKKEMHAKDLIQKTAKDWEYGSGHFLTKLATISQLALMEPKAADEANDEILDITTQHILLKVRNSDKVSDILWIEDSEMDEECQAKSWALKILVNDLRSNTDPETIKKLSTPVYKLLNTLIGKNGEISKKNDTPEQHKTRLRLLAAQLMLKLCTEKAFEELLTPAAFNRLACIAQDTLPQVRRGFVQKLQKYLVRGRLPPRFYTIMFLLAFEPEPDFRQTVVTWIKSRAKFFQDLKQTTMEAIMPRLLSLLAHHPDYSGDARDLADHARYILFYVTSMANEENLGLIYKYAERVKQARDAISESDSDNLYVMSDLAQAVIRGWEDKRGWSMQSYSGKVRMPASLFAPMSNHETAIEVASQQYLPEEMDGLLASLLKTVKNVDKKQQKRKLESNDNEQTSKRQRSEGKPAKAASSKKSTKIKTPKTKKAKSSSTHASSSVAPGERRRSGRGTSGSAGRKSYADRDSSEDDEEMMEGVAEWQYLEGEGEGEGEDADDDDENEMSDAVVEDDSDVLSELEEEDISPQVDNGAAEAEDVAADSDSGLSPPPKAKARGGLKPKQIATPKASAKGPVPKRSLRKAKI